MLINFFFQNSQLVELEIAARNVLSKRVSDLIDENKKASIEIEQLKNKLQSQETQLLSKSEEEVNTLRNNNLLNKILFLHSYKPV